MRTPIHELKGIGQKLAERLHAMQLFCVQDLLFHLPIRYENRTCITPIAELIVGHKVIVQGEILQGRVLFGKKARLLCEMTDGSGQLRLCFFHFNASQKSQLMQVGQQIRCFGEVRVALPGRQLELVHPEYRLAEKIADLPLEKTLTPIYPSGAGILQPTWRKLMQQALQYLELAELPELFACQSSFSLQAALQYLHQPPVDAPLALILAGQHPAQQRLALEELVAHQVCLYRLRHERRAVKSAPILKRGGALQTALQRVLPFQLTVAQQRVVAEINADIAQSHPMLRLVQGDVGSGKTIVAALALLQAVASGCQAALMAPTELLAEQHYRTLIGWFASLGVRVAWLTGAVTGKNEKSVLAQIAAREVDVIVGTHALFQDKVQFGALALIVIDEQHRFGVHQRLALKEKGESAVVTPHQLIMTATPIPRTLAMSVYADLDVSVIDALPSGRKPVRTVLASLAKRAEIAERVRLHCRSGQQAYWVCTLIEDSEVLQAQAATQVCALLKAQLTELAIGLVHGRMKADEKEAVMTAFKARQFDVLVATTVIEVGVDVPNASVMVIENAERLGLAQLHQLRGRVGRGQQESFCVLLYQSPLSKVAKQRLSVMRDENDGFVIAETDLQMRGPGEVLGVRQTGLLQLKIADLLRDKHLLPTVKKISERLLRENPAAVEQLAARWLQGKAHYIEV